MIQVTADEPSQTLQGFLPFSSDWHAEATLLEVNCYTSTMTDVKILCLLLLYMQVIFSHLYKLGSNCDGGTLLQLRNLINRRNVAANLHGRFNATIDFMELVVNSHIIAADLIFLD